MWGGGRWSIISRGGVLVLRYATEYSTVTKTVVAACGMPDPLGSVSLTIGACLRAGVGHRVSPVSV